MYFEEIKPLTESSYSVLSLFGGNAWYPMTMIQSNKEIAKAKEAFAAKFKIPKPAEVKLEKVLDKIAKGEVNKLPPINLIDIDGYLNARRRMDVAIKGYNKAVNKSIMETERKDFYGTITYPLMKEILRSYTYDNDHVSDAQFLPYVLKDKYLIYFTFNKSGILNMSYVGSENYRDPMCPINLALIVDGEPVKFDTFKK
jgi:hypothetical protein